MIRRETVNEGNEDKRIGTDPTIIGIRNRVIAKRSLESVEEETNMTVRIVMIIAVTKSTRSGASPASR